MDDVTKNLRGDNDPLDVFEIGTQDATIGSVYRVRRV